MRRLPLPPIKAWLPCIPDRATVFDIPTDMQSAAVYPRLLMASDNKHNGTSRLVSNDPRLRLGGRNPERYRDGGHGSH